MFKKYPTWLKGGLISVILVLMIATIPSCVWYGFDLSSIHARQACGATVFAISLPTFPIIILLPIKIRRIYIVINIIIPIIFYFAAGSIIGIIIEKRKNRLKHEPKE